MNRLRVDWCSVKAARFAVLNWHYSQTMPIAKTVRLGVWFEGAFKGAVIFGRACRNQHLMFGVRKEEVCELARVALDQHEGFHVSAVVARALKRLKERCPGLRLVVSFADPAQGHEGKIYQAGNWIYLGTSAPVQVLVHQGKRLHRRKYTGVAFGRPRTTPPPGSVWITTPGKHRYAYPLDRRTRRRLQRLARPYPAHEPTSADARAAGAEHQLGLAVQPRPSASPRPPSAR